MPHRAPEARKRPSLMGDDFRCRKLPGQAEKGEGRRIKPTHPESDRKNHCRHQRPAGKPPAHAVTPLPFAFSPQQNFLTRPCSCPSFTLKFFDTAMHQVIAFRYSDFFVQFGTYSTKSLPCHLGTSRNFSNFINIPLFSRRFEQSYRLQIPHRNWFSWKQITL